MTTTLDLLFELLPTGRHNAIRRRDLKELMHVSDRDMRRAIHDGRQKRPILNLSDGSGYYLPDMDDPDDMMELRRWIKQEESRSASVEAAITAAKLAEREEDRKCD